MCQIQITHNYGVYWKCCRKLAKWTVSETVKWQKAFKLLTHQLTHFLHRYLFFFHRRPEHGPMRVQLTNPVSRFKHIQSLQHMCRYAIIALVIVSSAYLIASLIHSPRFVIRRAVVRKDLIQTLPLPRRLLDYLSYKNCYSELVESDSSQSPTSEVRFYLHTTIFAIHWIEFCLLTDDCQWCRGSRR